MTDARPCLFTSENTDCVISEQATGSFPSASPRSHCSITSIKTGFQIFLGKLSKRQDVIMTWNSAKIFAGNLICESPRGCQTHLTNWEHWEEENAWKHVNEEKWSRDPGNPAKLKQRGIILGSMMHLRVSTR